MCRNISGFISLLLVAVLPAFYAAGQQHPPVTVGTKITVRPEVAVNPNEQIAHCSRKIRELRTIKDPHERLVGMLQVMSSLAIVPVRWPEAKAAVLESSLMRADLALQWEMPQNAVESVLPILRQSEMTNYHVELEERLGRAYLQLGDTVKGEAHLVAASKSPMFSKVNHAVATGVLQELAMLYSRTGRSREAAKQWRSAAMLPSQTPNNRAAFLLAALKEAVAFADAAGIAEANGLVHEVEAAIRDARSGARPDPRALAAYESDLARLKKRLRH